MHRSKRPLKVLLTRMIKKNNIIAQIIQSKKNIKDYDWDKVFLKRRFFLSLLAPEGPNQKQFPNGKYNPDLIE